MLHLVGEALSERLFELFLELEARAQADRRDARGLNRERALAELGRKLAAERERGEQASEHDHRDRSEHRLSVSQVPAERPLVEAARGRHEDVRSLRDLAPEQDGHERGDERHGEHGGGGEREHDRDGHRAEHLPRSPSA